MNDATEGKAGFRVPPPQKNLDRATELAFEALARQPDEQMQWLGAEQRGGVWQLPVLGDTIQVDPAARCVTTGGREIGPHWRIVVLHYLAIPGRPDRLAPQITFADLQTARTYNKVYEGRTVGRLCATVGRTESGLRAAAAALGAHDALGGDAAFDFDVFPRLTLRLVWHAADEEFPPSATILLPGNIEDYFCAEDTVVLSERLVSRLCGRPF
jgi:hypothetical protein